MKFDRTTKSALYAQAGIADYWILNLNERVLEVRRDPIALPDNPGVFGYASLTILSENDTISALAKPEAMIQVGDLFPPVTETGEQVSEIAPS